MLYKVVFGALLPQFLTKVIFNPLTHTCCWQVVPFSNSELFTQHWFPYFTVLFFTITRCLQSDLQDSCCLRGFESRCVLCVAPWLGMFPSSQLLMWDGMGDGMEWSGQCQRMGAATPGLQLAVVLCWEGCPRKTDLVRTVLCCIGWRVRSTRTLKIHPEPVTPGRDWLLVKQPQNWGLAGSSKTPREQVPVPCSYCQLFFSASWSSS